MRSTIFTLLATATIVYATQNGCSQNIEDIVSRTSCGCTKDITKCLLNADLWHLDEIVSCYMLGGCAEGDAIVESVWLAKGCHEDLEDTTEGKADLRADLRRRTESASTDEATSTTAKTTTEKTSSTTTASTSTSSPASTTASTTSESSTTSASTTVSTSTTVSSTTSSSTTSTSSSVSSTTSSVTTGTLLCSSTSTKTTSYCYTVTGTSTTCVSTTTDIATCAAGNLCFTSTSGADVCMKKEDSLTTSGLVVTIAFAIGIFATIVVFTIFQVRVNSAAKKRKMMAAMAMAGGLNGKGRDIEETPVRQLSGGRGPQGNASEANLPLITSTGPPQHDGYFSHGPEEDNGNSATPPNRGSGQAPKIQIHQGLGSLEQESHY